MAAPVAMLDLAALVVLVEMPAWLARMRLPLWAVQAGPVVMPAWLVTVPRAQMVLLALCCREMVSLAARAVLEALVETAALVDQAVVEPRAAVAAAGLVWLPLEASAVSAVLAVQALTQAL